MIAPPKPPSHDEPELLIKEARERQLRRRLLGAAVVAVAAAIGLSVYAFTLGGNAHGGATSDFRQGSAPRCRSSQLSANTIWDGAAGHLFNFFTIVNRGTSACSLPVGRPKVLLTRRGSPLKVDEQAASSDQAIFGPGKPLRILPPGHRAVVHLAWWNWCGRNIRYAQTTSITVQFTDGLRLTVPHLLGQPPCFDPTEPSVLAVSQPMTPN